MPVISIDLRGAISQKMNPAFWPIMTNQNRIQLLYGGASSSKSYSIAEKIIYKTLLETGHKWLVVRKVGTTLRHSVFDQLLKILRSWNLYDLCKINNTELTITCKANGNMILFTGLDDVEKLKSIEGITGIWIEEATELTERDFNQLDLRLRGVTKYKKQIILSMNPISILHWIKKRFFDRQEDDCFIHHSTYRDNAFLDEDSRRRLEGYTDPYWVSVYVNGEWGVLGNVVFSNFVVEDFPYTEEDLENVSNGIDFGFAHASAFLRCGEREDELYVFDELYGKGWVNADFIAYTKEKWPESPGWNITAESAEPDRLEEWNRAGYRFLVPAKKGAGSLKYGVDFLCSRKMHVHPRCVHLIQELQTYKRREDKDGNVQDAFVEVNDDCIAALRYASEWMWAGNQGMVYQTPEYSAADLGL